MAGKRGEIVAPDPVTGTFQHPQEGDRRRGVGHQLEPGDQVDDLRSIEQPARTDDLDGNGVLVEGSHDGVGEAALAAEHRDPAPGGAVPGDVGGDGRRLLRVVGREKALDRARRRALPGAERLLQRVGHLLLDAVCEGHQLGAEAECHLERTGLHRSEVVGEPLQVEQMGAAERVDRLHVVADRGDRRARRVDDLEHPTLGEVGVLVLVEQHHRVLGAQSRGEIGPLLEQANREPHLIAVVDEVALTLAPLVRLHDLAQLEPCLGCVGHSPSAVLHDDLAVGDDRLDRHEVVGAARGESERVVEDDPRHHRGAAPEAELVEDREEQLPGLGAVQHLSVAIEAELEGVAGDESAPNEW